MMIQPLFILKFFSGKYHDELSYNDISVFRTSDSSSSQCTKTQSYSYASYDIVDKSSGEVVFQGAPQVVEQVTIPALEEVEQIPQAMTQTLQVVIPVGLVVFGIGLVIFLVRYLILRLM